jgi:hypothetical protein
MTEKVNAAKAIQKNKTRADEIKARIRDLDNERKSLPAMSSEASALVNQWTSYVEYVRNEFVSELSSRVSLGRNTTIKLDSPGAVAFILGDQLLTAIPELAKRCTGNRGDSAQRARSIDSEREVLLKELSGLGIS